MKHVILATFIAMMCFTGYAQSDSVNLAFSRIESLESTVNSQAKQLNKLSSDLNEVLKQNLALKQNLHLKPTIAKAIAADILEYRVLEVTGDKSTNEVHVVLSVNNIGDMDKKVVYLQKDNEIIDEQGHGYIEDNRYNLKMNGITDNLIYKRITHHPNTPLTIDLNIKRYNPECQYIKYLELVIQRDEDLKSYDIVFQNLPIKWEDGK